MRESRPKILIVRSAERTLERYAAAAESGGARVVAASTPGVPYDGARRLLSMALGASQERATAGLAPAANPTRAAFLPRAMLEDGATVEAWSSAIARVFDGSRAPVLVRVQRTDVASLLLLRPIFRAMTAPPPLVLLDAPARPLSDPAECVIAERRRAEMARIRALPWTRREVLTDVDGAGRAPIAGSAIGPAPAAGIDGVRAAFGAHAMDAALFLGRGLLARDAELASGERGELHAMCAIAAASLAGAQSGLGRPAPPHDVARGALVTGHITHALASELDADVRACVMLVACAAEPSVDSTRRAIEAARRVPPQPGRYIEAWARRARAHVMLEEGRTRDAVDDLEEALTLLALGVEGIDEREIVRTQHLLARDLSKALAMRGDHDSARAWRAQAEACAARLPDAWAVPYEALDLTREGTRLPDAIREGEARAARARAAWEPDVEAARMRDLAALYTCGGDARKAYACARLAKRLREALRVDSCEILDAEVACAKAAYHAGMLDAASAGLDAALDNPHASDDARSELYAALARSEARRGNVLRAEEASLEALARLDANANVSTAARVLLRVGEAYVHLGRPEAANRVFVLALGWSDDPDGLDIPAPERLALLLGLWESGRRDRDVLLEALRCVEDALEEPDAWWDVRRLEAALRTYTEEKGEQAFLDVQPIFRLIPHA